MSEKKHSCETYLLNSIIENSSDVIIIISTDNKIVEFNKSALDFLGQNKEEIQNKDYLYLCDYLEFPVQFKKFLGSKEQIEFQNYVWSNTTFKTQNNESHYVIIGKVSAKNSLQHENFILKSIIASIPGSIYWKDTKGTYLGCNDFMVKVAGFSSKNDIIGKKDQELWPNQARTFTKTDQEVMNLKCAQSVEERVDLPNGKTRFFTVEKTPLFDDKKNVIGILGNSLEITELKNTQEELTQAKETAESALQSLQQAQVEERKQREEAERLAIENAANKAELEIQEKFITVVNRIAHDVAGSMGVIKKMTKYFSNLKEITSISGYEMRPISASEREDNIIYIQADDNGLQYEVLDSQKELKKGVASWEQLFAQLKQDSSKIESDFLEFQKEYLPILLEYTEKLGFTKKKMIERRIPEAQRVQLENSTQKAMTIMEGILSKYLNPEENQDESISVFPPSLAIHDAFAETRLNYEHQGINFIEEFNSNSQMVFIEGQRSQINRAITNLLRNAAQALDGKPGDVVLKLDSDEFYVYITIQDTGKGMPSEMVNKIKNNIAFTEGKKDGHGIGLGQVHATLNRNFAEMDIISELGKSTQFIIKFKKSLPPNWAAQTIEITPKDKVIIVDDDPSIHGDWGFNFEPIIEKHPSISIHNFYESQKALDYIHSLPLDEQNNILLLSDFELAHDARNGLNVIEESKVKRAFLVTSHCNEPDIQQALLKLNAKLLPKKLNQYIPIIVLENKAEYSEANLKEVDGIWLDDDAGFTLMHEQDLVMSGKKVDIYRSPKALMDNIHIYPKHIPILLDNNFEATSIRGTGVAKDLHERGFTKLFLVSGDKLNPNDYPYLTILGKGDLDDICKYF